MANLKECVLEALNSPAYRAWFTRWWHADFSVEGSAAKAIDSRWVFGEPIAYAGRNWSRPRWPPHDLNWALNEEFFSADFSAFRRRISHHEGLYPIDLRGAFVPGFQVRQGRRYAIHFQWACVLGDLLSTGVDVDGTGFEDAIFAGNVNFDSGQYEHAAIFHRATFLRNVRFANMQRINADGAEFCAQLQLAATVGDAAFAGATVAGAFELNAVSRLSNLNLTKARLLCGVETGQNAGWYEHSKCLDFTGVSIAGSLEFGAAGPCQGVVRLDRANIASDLRLRRIQFQNEVSFNGCVVGGDVDISVSNFSRGLDAGGADVAGGFLADHAVFKTLSLRDAKISCPVQIRYANVEGDFVGEGLQCNNRAVLDFSQLNAINLRKAKFERGLSLRAVHSSSGLPDPRAIQNSDFTGATFGVDAQFDCADFSHRRFVATANFNSVKFDGIPRFHESGLHEDTSFANASFRMLVPEKIGEERSQVLLGYEAAFRSLKHRMEQIRSNRDWRKFHRLELRVRRMRRDKDAQWLENTISLLYELTSDYGESIGRPIGVVLFLVLVMTPIYWWWAGAFTQEAAWAAFSFSWEQLFRPFALWRVDLPSLADAHVSSAWMKKLLGLQHAPVDYLRLFGLRLITSLHSIASFTLLFLFGLAIRRRFQVD